MYMTASFFIGVLCICTLYGNSDSCVSVGVAHEISPHKTKECPFFFNDFLVFNHLNLVSPIN